VKASLDQKTFERGFRQLFGYEAEGEKYLQIRTKLVSFFRDLPDPEELADEVLDRMIRKAAQEGVEIQGDVRPYALAVARYVRMEYLKKAHLVTSYDLSELPRVEEVDTSEREERLEILVECLKELTPDEMELILEYHGQEGRKKIEQREKLAADLGISLGSLRVRAHRIRAVLEEKIERKLRAIARSRIT
jgi:DNA-directed RNA polymerase specialized sigma24 family protein